MDSSTLVDRIASCLASCGLARGVVSVSGGPDSVALAHAAVALQADGKVGKLIVAHFNHQLRGTESDGDEAFVEEVAQHLGHYGTVCFRCERADTARLAREGGENLESCARRLRYEWLARVAEEENAVWVATGHTADDQAETVLHRLIRGTGLQGLAGIPERRTLAPGIALLRPLLKTTRADVIAYLRSIAEPFREDSSNRDLQFTRNRIRHELLPLLAEHYNPAIVSILTRLADQARAVHELVADHAAELLRQVELPRAGDLVILDARRLSEAPSYLVREVFRIAWTRESWPQGEMSFEHWERLAALAQDQSGAVDLPGGVSARRVGHVVQVGRTGAK